MKKFCFLFLSLSLLVACSSPVAHHSNSGDPPKEVKSYVSIAKEVGKLNVPTSKMITLPYSQASHPVVMGSDMYIAVNTKWGYLPNEVRKVDLNTKKETTIFKTEHFPSAINDLQASEDWMIWVDSTEEGYENCIWAKNLKTGKMKKIYQQPAYSRILVMAGLYDHYVAWTHEKPGKVVTVRLMDLKTGKTEDIAQYHTFSMDNSVEVDPLGGRFIWNDSENGVGFFKVFDVKTQRTTSYPLPGYTPGYSNFIGDNHILFKNSKDHFVNTTNPPVCIYDLKTKQYQILSEDKDNTSFRIMGNYIFYLNNTSVQSFFLKDGQFTRKRVVYQMKEPEFIYTRNHHLILEKTNNEDGRTVSTTYEVIDLTHAK